MLDLDNFLDGMHSEIKSHTQIEQLILGTQDIPPKLMKYPRMRMAFTTRYNPQQRHELIYYKNLVPSDDEGCPVELYFVNKLLITRARTGFT